MEHHFYGNIKNTKIESKTDEYLEQLHLKGFVILEEVIPEEDLDRWRKKIDDIYHFQKENMGEEVLNSIQEIDMCRAPVLYDLDFIKLIAHPLILEIIKAYIGENLILNLQNAIINRPHLVHHQTKWHRDIPYQNFLTTKPISVNSLIVIDAFSKETGSTQILPFSHKFEHLPSNEYMEKNFLSIEAKPGSIVLFDSMLFHRAGLNQSNIIRRAINQMYTIPLYKQQYDFPKALESFANVLSKEDKKLLGFDFQVPKDDVQWRKKRHARILEVAP